jgi:hypothetical protein
LNFPLEAFEGDSSHVCLSEEQGEVECDERARACHRGSRPDLRETHDHILKRDGHESGMTSLTWPLRRLARKSGYGACTAHAVDTWEIGYSSQVL